MSESTVRPLPTAAQAAALFPALGMTPVRDFFFKIEVRDGEIRPCGCLVGALALEITRSPAAVDRFGHDKMFGTITGATGWSLAFVGGLSIGFSENGDVDEFCDDDQDDFRVGFALGRATRELIEKGEAKP